MMDIFFVLSVRETKVQVNGRVFYTFLTLLVLICLFR